MQTRTATWIAAALSAAMGTVAVAAVTNQVVYRLGESGTLSGALNYLKDSSGNGKDFVNNFGGTPSVDTTNYVAANGSSASLRFGGTGTTTSGFYNDNYSVPLTGNFGIEVFVKPTTSTGETISASNNGWILGSDIGGLALVTHSSTLIGGISGSSGAVTYVGTGATIDTSKFTEIAIVNDGGTTTFYVNGVASGATSSASLGGSVGAIHMGVTPGGATGGYAGNLDEARIFTFTAGQFNPSTDLTPVPEPASLGLLGIGSLALLRRRRIV